MNERCWRWMLIVVISLQLISGTADAEENPYTANDLLQGCKATLRRASLYPGRSILVCAWAWMPGCHYIDAKSCAPVNTTNDQLIRVVLA
jgi:hypothetical protein